VWSDLEIGHQTTTDNDVYGPESQYNVHVPAADIRPDDDVNSTPALICPEQATFDEHCNK
jgi:hypothetical protein